MAIRATEVFTPNDFPTYSYVDREEDQLENKLQFALDVPKVVISLSGPSKAGKTVLVERVVGMDRLIPISGAEIRRSEDLWDRVLDWMGVPGSSATGEVTTDGRQTTTTVGAEGGVPLVAKAKGDLAVQASHLQASSSTSVFARGGLTQVAKEIAGSDFVIFLDDFHYIERAVQTEVAKQVKAAAEKGVRVCLAAVPYRADDAVRSNAELRGRTTHIDVGFFERRSAC